MSSGVLDTDTTRGGLSLDAVGACERVGVERAVVAGCPVVLGWLGVVLGAGEAEDGDGDSGFSTGPAIGVGEALPPDAKAVFCVTCAAQADAAHSSAMPNAVATTARVRLMVRKHDVVEGTRHRSVGFGAKGARKTLRRETCARLRARASYATTQVRPVQAAA
jgi:hypothetical protein